MKQGQFVKSIVKLRDMGILATKMSCQKYSSSERVQQQIQPVMSRFTSSVNFTSYTVTSCHFLSSSKTSLSRMSYFAVAINST